MNLALYRITRHFIEHVNDQICVNQVFWDEDPLLYRPGYPGDGPR